MRLSYTNIIIFHIRSFIHVRSHHIHGGIAYMVIIYDTSILIHKYLSCSQLI